MRVRKVYVAASLRLKEQISKIRSELAKEKHITLFVPEDFVPTNIPKSKMPKTVALECINHIKKSDVIVVLLDDYGNDTSFEIGFAYCSGKRLLGLYTRNEPDRTYERDYMIRNSLDKILNSIEDLVKELAKSTRD